MKIIRPGKQQLDLSVFCSCGTVYGIIKQAQIGAATDMGVRDIKHFTVCPVCERKHWLYKVIIPTEFWKKEPYSPVAGEILEHAWWDKAITCHNPNCEAVVHPEPGDVLDGMKAMLDIVRLDENLRCPECGTKLFNLTK